MHSCLFRFAFIVARFRLKYARQELQCILRRAAFCCVKASHAERFFLSHYKNGQFRQSARPLANTVLGTGLEFFLTF